MKQLLCWILILCVVLQPIAQLALGDSEGMDHEHLSEAAREYRERAEQEAQDKTIEERVRETRSENGDRHVDYHCEYVDHEGHRQSADFEHEIKVVDSHDGKTAFRETNSVTTHDIPTPREVQIGPAMSSSPAAANLPAPFHEDLVHFGEYQEAVGRTQSEPSRKDIPSRIELESEVAKLNAATRAGAAVTDVLSTALAAQGEQIDKTASSFDPPEVAPDELVSLQTSPPPHFDTHLARSGTISNLKRTIHEGTQSESLDALTQAVNRGLISEIDSALTPRFTRLGAFLKAHSEALRAGAELAVDIAVTALPIVSIAWGLANLATIAARGTTVMGTPMQGAGNVTLLALGALAPAVPIKQVVQTLTKAPAIAKGFAIIEKYAPGWIGKELAANPENAKKLAQIASQSEGVIIETPYGIATQTYSEEALTVRARVEQTRTIYREGEYGASKTIPGRATPMESPQNWAPVDPRTTPDFHRLYGTNVTKPGFVEVAEIPAGTPFVTQPAAPFNGYPGGAIEVVVPPGGAISKGHFPK